jgi:tetratricopeptide (TPR) repeat protein
MRWDIFSVVLSCVALTLPLQLVAVDAHANESSYMDQVSQANARAHQGQLDAALEQLNAVIISHPQQSRAYKVRGNVYFAKENYRAALSDFNKVVQFAPEEASSYLDRAIVHLALKNYAQAFDDTNQALVLQPDNREAVLLKLTILENHSQQKNGVARVRAKGEKLRN